MLKPCIRAVLGIFVAILVFSHCSQQKKEETTLFEKTNDQPSDFHGYESQVAYGKHLVTIMGCNDCHTPKKMTEQGPVPDMDLQLSGHPANMPRIDINREEIEGKGYAVTMDLTEWLGPWGVSFAANLTPDGTGIGNWTEDQFIYALREGKAKGIPGARTLLPPMPWEMFRHMTDDELKAIFAYLKSIKPINNLVPLPEPPLSAGK